MNFRTVYDRVKIISVSGEKDRPDYKPMYLENGAYELVECGKIHSYEDIQSFAPLCDMSQLMERYFKTGDTTMLNRRSGFFADVSNLPSNYSELHNMLDNADRIFNSLPLDLRSAFGNSPAVFYADKAKADEIVKSYYSKKVQPVVNTETPSVKPVVNTETPSVKSVVEGGVLNE